ncbi:MAG: SDR family NAD(P)-dependent oxidoreductase, partial [Calditrichaeota bacterium]
MEESMSAESNMAMGEMQPLEFNNQVVLLTGGNGGIGRAVSRLFLQAGATVVSVDVQPPEEELPGVRNIQADVASFAQVGECVADVLAHEGRIDCLINNAGISRDTTVWRMTEEQWDVVLDVNLKGAFNFIHHVAPH